MVFFVLLYSVILSGASALESDVNQADELLW